MSSFTKSGQRVEPIPVIDTLLGCSTPGRIARGARTPTTVPPPCSQTDLLLWSNPSFEPILLLLNKLLEQQERFSRSQTQVLERIEEKEHGFRRWVELLVSQKEGELWMQLEQHHADTMAVLREVQKIHNPSERQLDILRRYRLGGMEVNATRVTPRTTRSHRNSRMLSKVTAASDNLGESHSEKDLAQAATCSSVDWRSASEPEIEDTAKANSPPEHSHARTGKHALHDLKHADLPKTWPTGGTKRRASHHDLDEEYEEEEGQEVKCFTRFVRSVAFDAFMSAVILANLCLMFVAADFRSSHTEYTLNLHSDDSTWETAKDVFEGAEFVFCGIYIIELTMRLIVNGTRYLHNFANLLDALVVLSTSVETFVFTAAGWSSADANFALARLLRLTRVARIAKVIRFANNFSELRVLVRTLRSSIQALILSMMLLSFIVMAGGVLISQSLAQFVENPSQHYGDRIWAFERFGSASKATQRLFDATFSFSWVQDSRRMYEKIDGKFALFWVLWVVLVNFTTMRIIEAIFLKQTLVVASEDSERMELQQMAEKETHADDLKKIFIRADTSGDGMVSAEEFLAFIYTPEVAESFIKLDLELIEVVALFRLLADESGNADYEEFLQGALKLKSTASTIDAIQILHASKMIEDQICGLAELLVGGYAGCDTAQHSNSSPRLK